MKCFAVFIKLIKILSFSVKLGKLCLWLGIRFEVAMKNIL